MVKINPNLFFILGCQRTGTTLVRLILECHSKIFCVDEYRAYSILQDQNLLKKEIKSNLGKQWLGFKTPRITEQLLEPFLADIGIDFRTQNHFKNKPIVFLVRDVLDTITSMSLLEQNGMSWLKRWATKTIDFWCKTNPFFVELYQHEINFLKNANNKDLVAGALCWKFKTSSYFSYVKNSVPIILIHYEDLVTKKQIPIKRILDFLNLEWEDSLLSHEKISHPETDESGITVGNNDSKIPIHSSSVGIHKKFLKQKEKSEILNITHDLMSELNYKIES